MTQDWSDLNCISNVTLNWMAIFIVIWPRSLFRRFARVKTIGFLQRKLQLMLCNHGKTTLTAVEVSLLILLRLQYWDNVYDVITAAKSTVAEPAKQIVCPKNCVNSTCNMEIENLVENFKMCQTTPN